MGKTKARPLRLPTSQKALPAPAAAQSPEQDTKLTETLIGIDIGGTGIKGGLVDPAQGTLLAGPVHVPTPQPATPAAVAEAVAQVVDSLAHLPDAPAPHAPVGIAFPGIIRHGVVHSAANVDDGWLDTDIVTFLGDGLGRPVEVINDADAAGLAESRYGAGAGITGTILVITLGTGIGSAFIFNGQLVPNSELGHLEVDGCDAETKASAVARERNGLPWDEYSVVLQRYFSHVEFLFSPELFIVGGGISQRTDKFIPRLNLRTPIVPARLFNDAGIIGAALHRHQKHLSRPS